MTIVFPLSAIILAGGRGTRLAGLHPDLPKPMIPVAGQPFLHWMILWTQRQGIGDFVFSTGHQAAKIEEWLPQETLLEKGHWHVCREEQALGTGGGVRACLDFCRDDILVTNGDSLIMTDLRSVIELFLADTSIDAVLVGKNVPDASRYASLAVDQKNRLIAYREKEPGQGLISAGVYLFCKKTLEAFPAGQNLSMEYDIMPKLLADGAHILVHRTADAAPFIDIGIPETLAAADNFIHDNFES